MKTLNKNKRQEASKWLSNLLAVHGKNGWAMTRNVSIQFAALSAWCGNGVTEGEIIRVLQDMINRGENGLERFEELMLKYISDWESEQNNSIGLCS